MRMDMVTEECPDCGTENTFKWSVRRDGYQAFCPKCGFPMMLCGECLVDSDDFCDWDGSTILCHRMIERLWKDLEDVVFNEDPDGCLVLESDYQLMIGNREVAMFPAGTDREEIWHWFLTSGIRKVWYISFVELEENKLKVIKKAASHYETALNLKRSISHN